MDDLKQSLKAAIWLMQVLFHPCMMYMRQYLSTAIAHGAPQHVKGDIKILFCCKISHLLR